MTGLADGVALSLAIAVGGLVRWSIFGLPLIPSWSWVLIVAWWVMSYNSNLLPAWGIGIVEELRRVFLQLCLVFGGTAIVLFLVQQSAETSRFTLVVGFV
ncbi:MAG: hypothetical protein R3282_07050, partial [Rhodothermales bacterium]|nr:hypothetical protein [Rhodothermales bacterium]